LGRGIVQAKDHFSEWGQTVRKIFAVLAIVVVLSLGAAAQRFQTEGEAFAGFQYTNLDTFNAQRSSLVGWNGQVTGYIKRPLGVTAEFSGSYGSPDVGGEPTKLRMYTFLFGPTFRAPSEKSTPFVHVLLGYARLTNDGGIYSSSGFAYEIGGGYDVSIARNVSFRVAQLDYLATKLGDPTGTGNSTQHNFRVATGLVFKF